MRKARLMAVTYVPVLRFLMSRDYNKNSSRDSACFSPPHNKGPLPRFLSLRARDSVRRRACGVVFCCPMPPPKTSHFPHQNFPHHQNQLLTRWCGAVLSLRRVQEMPQKRKATTAASEEGIVYTSCPWRARSRARRLRKNQRWEAKPSSRWRQRTARRPPPPPAQFGA